MKTSRRRFLRLALGGAVALTGATLVRAQIASSTVAYLPQILTPPGQAASPTLTPEPTSIPLPTPSPTAVPPAIGDLAILGPATGTVEQAIAWLAPRTSFYTAYDIGVIAEAYRRVGESVGIDWFLALAQSVHETGSLTSFWAARPQRNPAGIGVTGQWSDQPPADPTGWAFNSQRNRWEVGVSFPTWADHAVPAHIGRLLAYALSDAEVNQAQYEMIRLALSYRGMSAASRGAARSWFALDGRWAVPGVGYGARIIDLARRIRGE